MPTAREKLEEVLRGMRMRQEQQAQAEGLWKRALPRCEAIARSLCDLVHPQGLRVEVGAERGELQLVLVAPDRERWEGARAVYRFNRVAKAMEGWRTPFVRPATRGPAPEHFFSLAVALPPQARHVNEFGPSGVDGGGLSVDTQEAFERSVVDFLVWALERDGCGGEPVRLP